MSGNLTKAALLGAQTRRFEDVEVPGLGTLRIASIAGTDWESWRDAITNKDQGEVSARLICLSAVDEKGERIFKDEDVPEIKKLDGALLHKLGIAIVAFNTPKE